MDGNVQDISVHDKNVAALAATEEAQDMSTLPPVLVPMPSFTDPHLPEAAAGSINLDLDDHPVEHSADYGGEFEERDKVNTPADESVTNADDGHPGRREQAAKTPQVELPENREEWTKAHYQAALRQAGLPVSGNLEAVTERYEEYEAVQEEYKAYNATDWKNDIEAAETADDLSELRAAYDRSGADFSTVTDAFEKKQADLDNDN